MRNNTTPEQDEQGRCDDLEFIEFLRTATPDDLLLRRRMIYGFPRPRWMCIAIDRACARDGTTT